MDLQAILVKYVSIVICKLVVDRHVSRCISALKRPHSFGMGLLDWEKLRYNGVELNIGSGKKVSVH